MDGEPGYVWDHHPMRRAPRALAEVLDGTELVVLGAGEPLF
ncbi:hypothetical protein [Streptomyces sp. NPDC005760]